MKNAQIITPTTKDINLVNFVYFVPSGNVPEGWPVPAKEIFYGLAGKYVAAIDPITESDPIALLGQFLTFYGNVVGRNSYVLAEADKHYPNLYAAFVGTTSKGRKGTALGYVKRDFALVSKDWSKERVKSGLTTGEGLVHQVRDLKEDEVQDEKTGNWKTVVTDKGVEDKRLLVIEREFASLLKIMQRKENNISAYVRDGWDTGTLENLSKHHGERATDAHISIISHITKPELLRFLDSTEYANGFGNRFLWFCIKRSKLLPHGGKLDGIDFRSIHKELKQAIEFGSKKRRVQFDNDAYESWNKLYPDLSKEGVGQFGAITARAEAQVLRLSLVYALLDQSESIRTPHLIAATALWKYCEGSAKYIFGDAVGDPIADELLRELHKAGTEGMTKTAIQNFYNNNKDTAKINRALDLLIEYKLIRLEIDKPAKGRPTETYYVTK